MHNQSRSLVLFKPDIYERGLQHIVLEELKACELKIVNNARVRFSELELLELWPKIHTLWGWLKSQEYMLGKPLDVLEVEGIDAIDKTTQIKNKLRGIHCDGDMIRKLIHTPDSRADYQRECALLFDMKSENDNLSIGSQQRLWLHQFASKNFAGSHRDYPISAVAVGSSYYCPDKFSDWDIQIFSFSRNKPSIISDWNGCFYENKDHDPAITVIYKTSDFLDSLFHEQETIALWIYQNCRVLRDDFEMFTEYIQNRNDAFMAKLPKLIELKYLRLRCARHAIDSVVHRKDNETLTFVIMETITRGLELLHLIHGSTFPYPRYLVKSFEKLIDDAERSNFLILLKNLKEANLNNAISRSRAFTDIIIDKMSTMGWERDNLEKWWLLV